METETNSPRLGLSVASDIQWFGLQQIVLSLSVMTGPSPEDHHSWHIRCSHSRYERVTPTHPIAETVGPSRCFKRHFH